MNIVMRRLRGLGLATLLGATTWGSLGLLVGLGVILAARLGLIGGFAISTSPSIPGGVVGIATVLGVVVGAINGLVVGLLVLAAERGHALERIPWWRFGLWGAAATGATVWLVTQTPSIAAGCAVLGGVGGVAALALARRQGGSR